MRKPGEPIEICHGQRELAVKIVQPGCEGSQLLDLDLKLVISAPVCPAHIMKSPQHWVGCFVHPAPELLVSTIPHELPPVVYPAFRIDLEGRVVFYLDDLLFSRPKGRYIGRIVLPRHLQETAYDGECLVELDIDLCTKPWIVSEVAINSVQPCG